MIKIDRDRGTNLATGISLDLSDDGQPSDDSRRSKGESTVRDGVSQDEINDIAYLAGLFDADGCASSYISKKKNTNYTTRVHSCEISMTNKEVIYWVKNTVGFGNIHYREKVGGMGKLPQWRYRASHKLALKFANLVLPYSIVKKEKLKKILDYYGNNSKI